MSKRIACEHFLGTGCNLSDGDCPFSHDPLLLALRGEGRENVKEAFDRDVRAAKHAISRVPCENLFRDGVCQEANCPLFHNIEVLKEVFPHEIELHIASDKARMEREKARQLATGVKRDDNDMSDNPRSHQVPRQACFKFFRHGRCDKGWYCPYSHDEGEVRNIDCNKFITSKCHLGKECPMRHDNTLRKRVPCEHYLKGKCIFPNCYRNHNDDELRLLRPKAPIYNDGKHEPSRGTRIKLESASMAAGADEDDEGFECSICLEALDGHLEERTLACFHTFHTNCLQTWLHEKHDCPLCRVKIE